MRYFKNRYDLKECGIEKNNNKRPGYRLREKKKEPVVNFYCFKRVLTTGAALRQ